MLAHCHGKTGFFYYMWMFLLYFIVQMLPYILLILTSSIFILFKAINTNNSFCVLENIRHDLVWWQNWFLLFWSRSTDHFQLFSLFFAFRSLVMDQVSSIVTKQRQIRWDSFGKVPKFHMKRLSALTFNKALTSVVPNSRRAYAYSKYYLHVNLILLQSLLIQIHLIFVFQHFLRIFQSFRSCYLH